MKQKSTKRAALDAQYLKLRKEYFNKPGSSICKARLPGCTIRATDIHHKNNGTDKVVDLLNESTWVSVCRNCHGYIHDKLSSEEREILNL
jgi:hypothetical protein